MTDKITRPFYLCLVLSLSVTIFARPTLGSPLTIQGNRHISSFEEAKKRLTEIYRLHPYTFYCSCKFRKIDLALDGCSYRPKKDGTRAHRVEWDHLVPAAFTGKQLRGWKGDALCKREGSGKRYKGRECVQKLNPEYKFLISDMYNLIPAEGEINGLRSDLPFGEIQGEARSFGYCDIEIKKTAIESSPGIRGDIARTYFYMDAAYPGYGILNAKNEKLFREWDRLDPVDAWECEKAEEIRKAQGNRNPFVALPCGKRGG